MANDTGAEISDMFHRYLVPNCHQAPVNPAFRIGVSCNMNNSSIILGDASSVLNLGPAAMQSIGDWQQRDSDQFGHFIQVNKQICESRWNVSQVSFTKSGDKFTGGVFPDIESFVYVAVYFRQLFHRRRTDQLFNRVCNRYIHFCADTRKTAWIAEEQKRFNNVLQNPFFLLPGYNVEQLIEAFIYGASILHGIPPDESESRKHFHELAISHPRERVLYSLHGSLKMLQNHVSAVAAVVYQDFARWLDENELPLPGVIWHSNLFQPTNANQTIH